MNKIPFRRSEHGRGARKLRRKELITIQKKIAELNLQHTQTTFYKKKVSLSLMAPTEGSLKGAIKIVELIGHCSLQVKVNDELVLDMATRQGTTLIPSFDVQAADDIALYVKASEDNTKVKVIKLSLIFTEK